MVGEVGREMMNGAVEEVERGMVGRGDGAGGAMEGRQREGGRRKRRL